MTEFSTIQPAFPAAARQAQTVEPTSGRTALSSDFETFLKMLTVQMQNQDPLNPVESSEYAVQLATFSSVEQQVLTNDLLGQLLGQSGAGLSAMVDWVGMEVRAPVAARFDGAPLSVWAEPATGADQAFLIARDSYGNEITRSTLSGEGGRVEWGGSSLGGSVLHGDYVFEIESQDADGTVFDRKQAEVYTIVDEARRGATGLMLITRDGHEIAADVVTAVRQP
jgi:flagellar basal-body rod modification protein FlgD